MDLDRPAAYHGPGWEPRTGDLNADVAEGRYWAPLRVDSEFAVLTDVALHTPTQAVLSIAEPEALQHLGRIDAGRLRDDVDAMKETYERLRIRVHTLPEPRAERSNPRAGANAMYARDLLWMTPGGAVIPRMASRVRAGEESQSLRLCAELDIPIARTVSGTGTFEGADALWLSPHLVAIGSGRRTNASGADQIREVAESFGARTLTLEIPLEIQHLLGILQPVGFDVVAARTDLMHPDDVRKLLDHGIDVLHVHESPEVTRSFAFNFVCVAPRQLVMTAGSDRTRDLLESSEIECVGTIPVSELFVGAGGIGCATSILGRRPVSNARS